VAATSAPTLVARDTVDGNFVFFENAQGANVGDAPRESPTERQPIFGRSPLWA